MIPTALIYLPALLLPVATQVARRPAAWLFVAAAVGFGIPALGYRVFPDLFALNRANSLFHDTYYVVRRAGIDGWLALVFALLAVLQSVKARLDREDRPASLIFFWTMLCALLGMRLLVEVVIPMTMPRRYVDYSEAMHAWGRANDILLAVAAVSLAALVALMILMPLWRRAIGRAG